MGNYDPPEPEKEPFAYTAAKLGIYAPIFAILLNAGLALHASSSTANATGVLVAKLIVPILGVALIAAGAVFSIVALCNTSRLGKEGLLGRGIIANVAHETVLRLLPPFVITRQDIDEFLSVLDEVLSDVEREKNAAPVPGKGV